MTSPTGVGTADGGGKKVLRFGDGTNRLSDPDLYLPRGLAARLSPDTDLVNEIVAAFTVSVATAMTVAATKSAASSRANG